jgi:hypothetical protein
LRGDGGAAFQEKIEHGRRLRQGKAGRHKVLRASAADARA